MDTRLKLGEILVRLRVLSHFDVSRVLEARNRRPRRSKFGQTAREMGLLTDSEILAALAVQMDLIPGIEHFTLHQILDTLANADSPT